MSEKNTISLPFTPTSTQETINFNDQEAITKYGFNIATNVLGNLDSVKDSLDTLYQKYLATLSLSDDEKEKSISEKQQMIHSCDHEIKQLELENQQLDERKHSLLEKISSYKDQLISLKTNGSKESINPITLIFGIVILIFLTIFLFLFYSSSLYSVFFGVPEDSLGFIIPDVFGSALENGLSTFLIITLLPMVFLCLGYVMHNLIDQNEKRKENDKKPAYFSLTAIILLAFLIDAIIGYKISEAVHHNKYIVGETDTLWSFNMIFSDVNFYLILALGFATYILWGICLHQVLSHPALKTLDEVTKEHIKKMDEKIAFEEKLVLEVDQMILSRTQQIYSIKEKINKLQQEIIDIRKGMVSININTIKGYVGAFKNGWITFLTNSQGKAYATQNSELISAMASQWLTDKAADLKEPIKL